LGSVPSLSIVQKNKLNQLLSDHWPVAVCLVCVTIFTILSIQIALHNDFDYWDAFNFINQSLRVTESRFSFVLIAASRPRALVIVFVIVNLISKFFFGVLPSIHVYHVTMVGIALAFAGAWYWVISEIWGSKVASAVTVFVLCEQMLVHYSASAISDLLTGASLALTLGIFLSFIRATSEREITFRSLIFYLFGLGLSGAFLGMGKHHFFPALPAMCFAYLLVSPRDVPTLRFRFLCCVEMLVLYVFVIDISNRIFVDPHYGVINLFLDIVKQGRTSLSDPSSALMYVGNLFLVYGPAFWVASLLGVVMSWRVLLPQSRKPEVRFVYLSALPFLLLIQCYPHREFRYFLPFLPLVLVPLVVCGIEVLNVLSANKRLAYAGLWILALVYPIQRSARDSMEYFSNPVFSAKATGADDLWKYIKSPSLTGKRCSMIKACWFNFDAQTKTRLVFDGYFDGFAFGPHYSFFTGLPFAVHACPENGESYLRTTKNLTSEISNEDCYLVREQAVSYSLATSTLKTEASKNYLVVLKIIGQRLSELERTELIKGASLGPSEKLICENDGKETGTCYTARRFFGGHEAPMSEKIASSKK
jgi:hypothetical protein